MMQLPAAQDVETGRIDYIEITLTDMQLIDMSHEDRRAYETLFRAAFDRGFWVTHWRDYSHQDTTYIISRDPRSDANQP